MALVGLSAVGKSTLVAALHGKASEAIVPTSGCNKSSLQRENVILDLLDLGGAPQVRKFWTRFASDVHAFVVVVNATEADDMSWAMLAGEVRRLRAGRPLLVLLNQRDVPAASCMSEDAALDLLGLEAASDVRIQTLACSTDAAAAEVGLQWLSATLIGAVVEEPQASSCAAGSSSSSSSSRPSSARLMSARTSAEDGDEEAPGSGSSARSRLRVVQALRDARQYAGDEAELAAALAQKLSSGHLLSSAELAKLRSRTSGGTG